MVEHDYLITLSARALERAKERPDESPRSHPQLLVQIGPLIVLPGEGVLKSVRRFGNRLSLAVEHEGQEAWSGGEVEQDLAAGGLQLS